MAQLGGLRLTSAWELESTKLREQIRSLQLGLRAQLRDKQVILIDRTYGVCKRT